MARWYFDDDFDRFPPSVPLKAKGGIRAQNKRGSFGESWWSRRWMQVLESFNLGGRLARGRSYARQGQVLSIEVAKGTVAAEVQGSRPTPYRVAMNVKALTTTNWKKVAEGVSGQALFAAKLLAGELPAEIEQVFETAGVTLFPATVSDLRTNCSCPDPANPCKHIAAVYCLLAEEFDRDPFLIFKLRGMSREEFSEVLAEYGIASSDSAPEDELILEPLCERPEQFWSPRPLRADVSGEATAPAMTAALVKRLGHLPFWRGREMFVDALVPLYDRASTKALKILNGDPDKLAS